MSVEVLNLKGLELDFKKISELVGIAPVLVQKKLAFDIFAGIVADTPVLTGRAMNNWNISIGSVDHSITEEGGTGGGIKGAKQAQATATLAGLQPGFTVWISNSLPYIVPLNEGSSDQAPANFVEANIANELNAISGVL